MRRAGAVLLAGTAAAVLAGCGPSSAADPTSPMPLRYTDSSVSASASGSATPAVDPNSDAAILAAVQAYATAFTAVAAQASDAPLQGVVDSSCPCLTTLRSLATQLAAKHWHEDVKFEAVSPRIVRRNATNADVEVSISNGSFHVFDQSGAVVHTEAGGATPTTLSFKREGDSWVVFYVDSA